MCWPYVAKWLKKRGHKSLLDFCIDRFGALPGDRELHPWMQLDWPNDADAVVAFARELCGGVKPKSKSREYEIIFDKCGDVGLSVADVNKSVFGINAITRESFLRDIKEFIVINGKWPSIRDRVWRNKLEWARRHIGARTEIAMIINLDFVTRVEKTDSGERYLANVVRKFVASTGIVPAEMGVEESRDLYIRIKRNFGDVSDWLVKHDIAEFEAGGLVPKRC